MHNDASNESIQPLGKNWPQGFYKRNAEVKAQMMKPIDRKRHDHSVYEKVVDSCSVVRTLLDNPTVFVENVYSMDETGVILSLLGALKVLVGRNDLGNYRGTGLQRTLITANEYISGDGRCLEPLIIWPAAAHQSA